MTLKDSFTARYRYLFRLPQIGVVVIVNTLADLIYSYIVGSSLFPLVFASASLSTYLFDLSASKLRVKDPILRFRRLLTLSAISKLVMILYILPASLIETTLILPALQASLSLAFYLRGLVLWSISRTKPYVKLGLTFQPLILYYCTVLLILPFSSSPILWAVLGLILSLITFKAIEIKGLKHVNISFPPLFYGFLSSWMEGEKEVLEEILERYGLTVNMKVGFLVFKTLDSMYSIVVPFIHNGPFLNVGSSDLPYKIKRALEKYGIDCVAVLHGASTHEYDLTSSKHSEKILESILSSLGKLEFKPGKATSMVRAERSGWKCFGQRFNNAVILGFTRSPGSTEDLPLTLHEKLKNYGWTLGLDSVFTVDCHNSTGAGRKVEEERRNFDEALKLGVEILDQLKLVEAKPFMVGGCSLKLEEYGLEEGVGPGGLTFIAFQIEGSREAYVIFDANNMVSGLRESIISALKEEGFLSVEVFTTDTHVVAGRVTGEGYRPLGEVVPPPLLVKYVKEASRKALARLKPVKGFGWTEVEVSGVRIIGGETLRKLEKLTDVCVDTSKKAILSSIILLLTSTVLYLLVF